MAGEIIQYQTEDGIAAIRRQAPDGDVWFSQADMAELFQTTVPNINKHIEGIIADGEQLEVTIEDHSIVRPAGARTVERQVAHYTRVINAPSAVEQRSLKGVGKAKAIEGGRPAPAKKGKA